MSKQAKPPPPGDKAKPSAPPPPPAWRNWLWPVMIFVILALFFLLPTRSPSTSITYSKFLSDVSAHQVKTVQLASTSGGTSTGTLTDGKTFTVVIPPQAGQAFRERLRHRGACLPDHLRAAACALHLALPPDLPRRGGRAAGHHGRGPVPGQGLRRGAADHQVRRRGRLRGCQVRDLRGGRLPEEAGPVHQGRRDGAARRPDGRAARHRQDAAGPRGRGRGGGAVLLRDGLRLRGAVRRRRRGPGP